MPELPEVETMCRGLHAIVGRTILRVDKPACACKPMQIRPTVPTISRKLAGQTVEQISRLGKRVLIHTAQWCLVLQPKMTGLVSLSSVPDPDHIRLRIVLRGKPATQVQFWDRRGLGTVELIVRDQIEQRLVTGKLGPDALEIPEDQFNQRLAATGRAIKVALLDQKILAGVGNLYASEMLHLAKIDPTLPASRLTSKQFRRLHAAMNQILLAAIQFEGSTLADGTYRNALNNPGSYQNAHRVYDRQGESCPTCRRATIERIVQAQRSTFYCPRCQASE